MVFASPPTAYQSVRAIAGLRLRRAKERVDDLDKSASLDVGATPRRSTESLAAYVKLRAISLTMSIAASLVGCGHSIATSPQATPPVPTTPAVIVTIDGPHHTCVVAKYNETHGRVVDCSAIAAYFRDDLRLPVSTFYDLRTVPDVNEAEMTDLQASLNGAGYHLIGGLHVGFITGPHTSR